MRPAYTYGRGWITSLASRIKGVSRLGCGEERQALLKAIRPAASWRSARWFSSFLHQRTSGRIPSVVDARDYTRVWLARSEVVKAGLEVSKPLVARIHAATGETLTICGRPRP